MSQVATGSSPQVLRALNARRVLTHAWAADAFTASDLMVETGLTRSTVIGVCDQLVRRGWLEELSDARAVGDYTKGRPARRYALRDRAGVVVGLEAGFERMSAAVADLRGRTLGRAEVGIPAVNPQSVDRLADAGERLALARRVVDEALRASGVDPGHALAITVGVPAPVDAEGVSPLQDSGFWQLVNPGYRPVLEDAAPLVTIENDANLAAIAEGAAPGGVGKDVDSYISLLVGEGMGAGLMIDGRLVRGRRGGAGEMRFLDRVEGVGSPTGLALLARLWATEAIRSGTLSESSALAHLDPDRLVESDVARAAAAGDPAALDIVERLATRLARISIVLGDLLDVDLIAVGGDVVHSLPAVIERAADIVAASDDPTAPRLVASALGHDAVTAGAVQHALAEVREHALEMQLAGARSAA